MKSPTDFSHEELMQDPYPIYKFLRHGHPVAYLPQLEQWWITKWSDCQEVGRLTGTEALLGGHYVDREFFGGPSILTMDGQVHHDLRNGIDPLLRPRTASLFADDTGRKIAIEYIERIKHKGMCDLVHDLFDPISVRVIGNRLGLEDVSDETLVEWFQALSGGLTNLDEDDVLSDRASQSLRDIDTSFKERINRIRITPDDSLISSIVHGGLPEGVAPRTFEEVMPTIRVIILGGFQEPGNSVANAFLGLLQNPVQWEALKAAPAEHASLAIHESLRWIAPIGVVSRLSTQEITVAGFTIPQDAQIGLVVASANRDESRYENPDEFNMFRQRESHATFGYGSHHCSGNFIAKSLGEIVIEETARHLPGLTLDPSSPPVIEGYLFRGTKSLPVTWEI